MRSLPSVVMRGAKSENGELERLSFPHSRSRLGASNFFLDARPVPQSPMCTSKSLGGRKSFNDRTVETMTPRLDPPANGRLDNLCIFAHADSGFRLHVGNGDPLKTNFDSVCRMKHAIPENWSSVSGRVRKPAQRCLPSPPQGVIAERSNRTQPN